MIDVFLSKPTYLEPQYKHGMDGFNLFLKAYHLNARTLGTTDFPNEAPLDEVIRLMKQCAGAIILGYPQIIVDSGKVKGAPLTKPLSLGTEWNHIEAALAYSQKLPILVIHDISVSRGVFERGTLNSYIYSVDFTNPNWFTQDSIIGALNSLIDRI